MARTRQALFQAFVLSALLAGAAGSLSAQSASPSPAPSLSLSVNGSLNLQVYQGWALIVNASLYNPDQFNRQNVLTPLTINAQNGSWANTVQLAVTDGNGIVQSWPIKPVAVPTGSITLDQTNVGGLTWVVAPSDSAAITAGTYYLIAYLNTTASAGTTGWNGATNSYAVSVQVSAPPSLMTTDQQEQHSELLATYDHLLGNDTQAVTDLDLFLAQQPNAVGALAAKGDSLELLGQTAEALDAYDQAVAAFYASKPGLQPEELTSLLNPQGALRSKLLSQSGARGTPQVAISLLDQGLQSPGVFFLDLRITNVGSDVAQNAVLNQLTFQTLSGAGQVFANNMLTTLPSRVDFLGVNASVTARIFVIAQGAVNSFSITENGTAADIFGTASAFSQTQTVSLNFTGALGPLTITAANATQQYGQPTPALNNATYLGFVNGDTPASLTGTLSCTTTATPASPMGNYPITCSGVSSPNYTITFVAGTLSITAAPLTLAATNGTRAYGAANPSLNAVTASGFVNGDSISSLAGTLNCATTATPASPVGTYSITCSGLSSANYSITFAPGELTIGPVPLTITANNVARAFGVANPPLNSVTASGFANGDTLASLNGSLTCTTTATQASLPDAYPITCSGLTSPNYTITYTPGVLTVTSDILTIAANNVTRQYGQPNPALNNVTYTGFVNGDTPAALTGTLACTTAASPGSSVGVYPINCSGLSSSAYAINFMPGVLTVTPAPLLIAANNASRPYGANNPTLTGTVTGLQNADPITANFSTVANPANPAGAYPITPVALDPSSRLSNYTVSLASGTLSVVPETTSLSVSLSPSSIPVGQPTTLTVTLAAPDMVIPIDPNVLAPITVTSPVQSDVLSNNGVCTPVPSTTPGLASCVVTVTSVVPNGRTLSASFPSITNLSGSTATKDLIVTATLQSQQSCIASDFRNVAVAGGNTVWFNSIFKVHNLVRQKINLSFFQSRVQFRYQDATGNAVAVNQPLPDARVVIDPSATAASTSFDAINNEWITTIPWDLDDSAFLTGMPWIVPSAGLPADVEPVTVCGMFASDVADIDIGWRWAAAAYSSFGSDGTTLGIKPMDTDHDNQAPNHDRAGTPENYRQFVIPGARGKGNKNYTGSYSGNSTIE
jgi:hypothetical protein